MRTSLKMILKTLLYGLFLLATFLLTWITSGSRDGKLGGLSLSSPPQAHADAPVGSDAGSDTGCAGCSGSGGQKGYGAGADGDGSGGDDGSCGSGGSGEGSGEGGGDGGGDGG